MDDRRDSPKSDNPRFSALTKGHGDEWYLARRYFQMSRDEWGDLPWYESTALMEGLRKHGVLGKAEQEQAIENAPPAAAPGNRKPPPVDLTGPGLIPPGFTTRLAG